MSKLDTLDWKEQEIGSDISIQSGYPFSSIDFRSDGSGFPLIRIRDLIDQAPSIYVTKNIPNEYFATKGDLLIGMDGEFNIIKWKKNKAAINQRVCKVRGNSKIDTNYLFYLLSIELPKINALTGSTTVKHLSAKDISSISTRIPKFYEQKKIADILTSVDEVIENTQSQINKLEDLKKATMNELLTKGIGHTEFKETEVGRIPKSWEVCTLESVSFVITKGTTPTTEGQTYVDSGVAFVKAESITTNEIIDMSKLSHISPKTHALLNRSQLKTSDVLITIAGALGRVAVVEEILLPANTNQAVAIIRPKQEKISSHYLKFFLKSLYVMQEIERLKTVGAQPNLSLAQIGNLKIPILTLEEQKTIVARCEAFANRITVANEKMSKLRTLKSSLMQDLLTGKVRVKVD